MPRKKQSFTTNQILTWGVVLIAIAFADICHSRPAGDDKKGHKEKAIPTVLFSNDFSNMSTCQSPYHKRGEPLNIGMLKATVEELAGTGVQAHMLQPGLGWVPLWKSKVLPLEEHNAWWREHSGNASSHATMKLAMGEDDTLSVFTEQCRKNNQIPFVSFRLNDVHQLENVNNPRNGRDINFCKFYVDHPEYRIGVTDPKNKNQNPHNWAIPEVRDYKFQFIKEICENYDIDGFELDFMRRTSYFRLYDTTEAQRVKIMSDFIRRVRDVLDRNAKPGQRRWLSVRIPKYMETYNGLGIDLPSFAKAGVDMMVFSSSYFTEQLCDYAEIARLVPDTAKYIEMTHCTAWGKMITNIGYDNFSFRRTTDEQFYTNAHLAYSRGFDGVALFNFVYYREHGMKGRGNYNEPPFHVFKRLGDKQWLARQPQHYFIAKTWGNPRRPHLPMPQRMIAGEGNPYRFHLDMASPTGGWTKDARLRLQAATLWGDRKVNVYFNQTKLKPNADISEPYPTPYTSGNGIAEQYLAYTVPQHLLVDGQNQIDLMLAEGEPVDVVYLDIKAE